MSNTISGKIATKTSRPDPRRNGRPADEVLCASCAAKCCRYFALPIDTPTTWKDFDSIRWFLLHDRATRVHRRRHVVSSGPHAVPAPRCGQSLRDLCNPAADLPRVLDDRLRVRGRLGLRPILETPEQVEEYAEAVLGPRRGRGFRSRRMTTPRITPRTLKGFRDYPPEAMIPRERLIDTARRVYRSYGFMPIDTPALEYLEILAGKGGEETDKQLYKFQDHGGRWVGLRFDLTVPLARFAAQHVGELGMPLKRYHIATVWRGENTQRGRYREFMQCDFDTIGTRSVAADIETVAGHPRPLPRDRLRAISPSA